MGCNKRFRKTAGGINGNFNSVNYSFCFLCCVDGYRIYCIVYICSIDIFCTENIGMYGGINERDFYFSRLGCFLSSYDGGFIRGNEE